MFIFENQIKALLLHFLSVNKKMNLQQKQIVTGTAFTVLLIVIVVLGLQSYWKTESAVKETINPVFVQSVKDAVQLKAVYKPDIRQVTISVPTKTSEKSANDSEIYVSQGYKLLMNRVNADTVNLVFQERLRERFPGVHSHVVVDYGDNSNSVSGDTLDCAIRYRTPVLHQEVFNEISYRGLVCYPLSVIFKQMPKGGLYILLMNALLLLFLFAYLLTKRFCIRKNTIIRHRNGMWNIGYTLFNPASGKLQRDEKNVGLPAQQLKIFQWLLEDESHRIEKTVLQETFWAGSLTGYNSMTCSINRLRNCLNEVDCDFTVSTEKGSECYELRLKN